MNSLTAQATAKALLSIIVFGVALHYAVKLLVIIVSATATLNGYLS